MEWRSVGGGVRGCCMETREHSSNEWPSCNEKRAGWRKVAYARRMVMEEVLEGVVWRQKNIRLRVALLIE